MSDMTDFALSLTGAVVLGVDVSSDEHALRFRLADADPVVWDTEGDCCSESWWADIFGLGALRGRPVLSVEQLELPSPEDGRSRQEVDSAYGFRLTTDAGETRLAFRNSSNGYYGGWANVTEDRPGYEWRDIAGEDWSA